MSLKKQVTNFTTISVYRSPQGRGNETHCFNVYTLVSCRTIAHHLKVNDVNDLSDCLSKSIFNGGSRIWPWRIIR